MRRRMYVVLPEGADPEKLTSRREAEQAWGRTIIVSEEHLYDGEPILHASIAPLGAPYWYAS